MESSPPAMIAGRSQRTKRRSYFGPPCRMSPNVSSPSPMSTSVWHVGSNTRMTWLSTAIARGMKMTPSMRPFSLSAMKVFPLPDGP